MTRTTRTELTRFDSVFLRSVFVCVRPWLQSNTPHRFHERTHALVILFTEPFFQ
jgi:hypothetical protein